jgi:GNAT superfamily N-acetyltransferase
MKSAGSTIIFFCSTNQIQMSSYVIRTATSGEIEKTHYAWAITEQWNPGLTDGKLFPLLDPEGFMVGVLNGEIISCISAVQLSEEYGFIGFYVCKEEFRGQGYGLQLFRAAMQRLSHLKCIGLDGVEAQAPNYLKSGFKSFFQSERHMYPNKESVSLTTEHKAHLVSLSSPDYMEACLHIMDDVHSIKMPKYLSRLFEAENVVSLGYRAFNRHDKDLAGFGVIRPAAEGWRIGPLYANSAMIAETIFQGLIEAIPTGQPIFIDIPVPNEHAVKLMERYQTVLVFPESRMYTGDPPPYLIDKIFGFLSLDVGP